MRTELDDNRRLRERDARATVGVLADVGFEAAYEDPRRRFAITPRLVSSHYAGREPLGSDDQHLAVSAEQRFERARLFLDGAVDRDTTTTSEIDVTGRVPARARRLRTDVQPRFELDLGPRTRLDAGLGATRVDYDAGFGSQLFDFSFLAANATVHRALGERTALFGSAGVSRFRVPELDGRTDTVSLRLGTSHAWTERLDTTLVVGVARSEGRSLFTRGREPTRSTDLLLDAAIERRLERGEISLGYRRELRPTADGEQVLREELRGRVAWRLSPRDRLTGTALAFRNTASGALTNDREVLRFGLRYERRLTEWWTLQAEYRHVRRENLATRATADSNAVMAGLRYAGRRWSMSR